MVDIFPAGFNWSALSAYISDFFSHPLILGLMLATLAMGFAPRLWKLLVDLVAIRRRIAHDRYWAQWDEDDNYIGD